MNDEAFNALVGIGYSEEFLRDALEIVKILGEEQTYISLSPCFCLQNGSFVKCTKLITFESCDIEYRGPANDYGKWVEGYLDYERKIIIFIGDGSFKFTTQKEAADIIRNQWEKKYSEESKR